MYLLHAAINTNSS